VTRRIVISCLWLAVMALSRPSWAQVTPAAGYTPPDDTQSVKFGVTIFYDYTAQTSPTATAGGNTYKPNSFNVSRTYINFTGNISHLLSFRITPDITNASTSVSLTNPGPGETASVSNSLDGNYIVRLKYGFAQINLDDWTVKGSWVRLGLQQTPWVDYGEGVYRYRFQGPIMEDRDGLITSSDKGVSYHQNFANNYGDIHVGLYNGEGYSKFESGDQRKAIQVRATVRPAAHGPIAARGLRISGFWDEDRYLKAAPKRRGIINAFFEHKRFNAGVDFARGTDQTTATGVAIKSQGYSVWLTPFFKTKGDGVEALLRYDDFQPSTATGAHRQREIAGIAYWFPHPGGGASAAILFDVDHQTYLGVATNKIALHGLINF